MKSEVWRAIKGTFKAFAAVGMVWFMLSAVIAIDVKTHAFGIDAKTLDAISRMVSSTGITVWPNHSSDPYTCNSNNESGYYYNTTTSKFRLCNGSAWADWDSAVQDLTDLSDVFISSPSNNQVLRYDGVTDNRWENSASSAAALDDLSDVNSSSPTNGYVLTWVSPPGEWQDSAASSSSLSALTDTSITTPAEGERLVYDGTDSWDNTDIMAETLIFPVQDILTFTETEQSVVTSDNQVKVFRLTVPLPIDVSRIIWATATVSATNCDYGAVGVYTLDGNTKLIDSGAVAYSTNDQYNNIDITDVYLEAGEYWLAYTATDTGTSCAVLCAADPGRTTVPNFEVLMNTQTVFIGTAANPSSSGALPSTLGTITGNSDVDRIIVKFVGA
jgi:hypothetical protein